MDIIKCFYKRFIQKRAILNNEEITNWISKNMMNMYNSENIYQNAPLLKSFFFLVGYQAVDIEWLS